MDDFLLDDEHKSDKYEVSINELLFGRVYRPSATSVQKLLDDNGYYGRSRVEIVKNKKFGTDVLIKVHIYLYDSAFEYTWPFNTFFDLDKKCFGHNRRVPRGILTDRKMFFRCVKFLSIMFTPEKLLSVPLEWHELDCIKCRDAVKEHNASPDKWPWLICHTTKQYDQLKFYEKIIPFLSRIGLIVNNKFKVITKDDAEEVCDNLFDINYWSNI